MSATSSDIDVPAHANTRPDEFLKLQSLLTSAFSLYKGSHSALAKDYTFAPDPSFVRFHAISHTHLRLLLLLLSLSLSVLQQLAISGWRVCLCSPGELQVPS